MHRSQCYSSYMLFDCKRWYVRHASSKLCIISYDNSTSSRSSSSRPKSNHATCTFSAGAEPWNSFRFRILISYSDFGVRFQIQISDSDSGFRFRFQFQISDSDFRFPIQDSDFRFQIQISDSRFRLFARSMDCKSLSLCLSSTGEGFSKRGNCCCCCSFLLLMLLYVCCRVSCLGLGLGTLA